MGKKNIFKKITIPLALLLFFSFSAFFYAQLIQRPKNIETGRAANLPGDADGNGTVNILDFQLLSNAFGKSTGQTGYFANADFNADNTINVLDFQILSNNFGRTEPTNPVSPTRTLTPTPTSGPIPPGGNRITYQPIMDDIANPERGFYRQANIQVDQPYSGGNISSKVATDTLVWVYFHLENYRDPRDGPGVTVSNYQGKPLEPVGSGKGLDTVQKTFTDARNKGLKLIIRFLYVGYGGIGSNTNPATSQPDAPLSLVQQHINQLSPLFHSNKDVIAAFQFGWVGYWGEWHSSKYLYANESRQAVMNAMLMATPKDRMIEVRYPRYKQVFFGGPLTESQAYNQSDIARIGYHNDAFLRDENDGGTFRSNTGPIKVTNYCDNHPAGEYACWRDYMNKDSRFTIVSGEAGTHSTTPSTFALCPNAIPAMEKIHFNSINNGYSQVTLGAWTSGGCMPEIRRRLGFRYELVNATLPAAVQRGSSFNLFVNLRNVGFGNMYNPRPLYAVLKNGTSRHEIPLPGVDPRRWEAGMTSTINTNITIPSSVPAGTYSLSLWLPDASQSIRDNVKYSVRFANANTWESTTGLNILTSNLTVQ